MNLGLDIFIVLCWIALGLIVLALPVSFFLYMVRWFWSRSGEQVWQNRMEKLAAER